MKARFLFSLLLSLNLCAQQTPETQAETGNFPLSTKHWQDQVEKKSNLIYAKRGERKLRLNLFRPKNRPANTLLPGVVYIHGGGWSKGNLNTGTRQATSLAAQGYAVACIEYRLVPEVRIKHCVEDCQAAVAWIRKNAGNWSIDPDRIAAIGGSAGGHLTAMLAVLKAKESRIRAGVAMATPSDMDNRFIRNRFKMGSEEAQEISPLRHVHAKQAPLLLLHCKQDRLVPYFSSNALQLASRGVEAECRLVEISQGGHAFWHHQGGWNESMRAFLPFLKKYLSSQEFTETPD